MARFERKAKPPVQQWMGKERNAAQQSHGGVDSCEPSKKLSRYDRSKQLLLPTASCLTAGEGTYHPCLLKGIRMTLLATGFHPTAPRHKIFALRGCAVAGEEPAGRCDFYVGKSSSPSSDTSRAPARHICLVLVSYQQK